MLNAKISQISDSQIYNLNPNIFERVIFFLTRLDFNYHGILCVERFK